SLIYTEWIYVDMSRSRAFWSIIAWKIGSSGNSGSPGKYICVIMRWVKSVPNNEKWTWAGRQALWWFFHGYGAGLIVVNSYEPSSPVIARPTPEKFGSIGAGC